MVQLNLLVDACENAVKCLEMPVGDINIVGATHFPDTVHTQHGDAYGEEKLVMLAQVLKRDFTRRSKLNAQVSMRWARAQTCIYNSNAHASGKDGANSGSAAHVISNHEVLQPDSPSVRLSDKDASWYDLQLSKQFRLTCVGIPHALATSLNKNAVTAVVAYR